MAGEDWRASGEKVQKTGVVAVCVKAELELWEEA